MYCGNPTGRVPRGEHLIPGAIGGTITTRDVCSSCNNGVLSDIDRELCSRSPLSIVAAKEIDGFVAQAWDVDENRGNLLIEGRPTSNWRGFRIYPQLIVTAKGEMLWANYDEMREFGIEKFTVLFTRRLLEAFWKHRHGDPSAFWFEQIPQSYDLVSRYRYWPRFFVRGSIPEACGDKRIILSYLSSSPLCQSR